VPPDGDARDSRGPGDARGLSSPAFRALLFGQVVSILGDRLNYLALVGLVSAHAATRGDSTAPWLSGLAWAMLLPSLVVSPWAGALVDRLPLVRLMAWTDGARALAVGAIPLAYASSGTPWAALACIALAFTLNAFFLPARSALPPHLVPAGKLTHANALLILSGIVATVVGSAFGGRLVDRVGPEAALYLDALTYVVSVVAFLWILRAGVEVRPLHAHAGGVRAGIRRAAADVRAGWARLARSPAARTPVIAAVSTWLAGGVLHVAGVPHVQRGRSSVSEIGLLLASLAVGAALGTALTLVLERRAVATRRAASLGLGLAGAGVGLAAFAFAEVFPVMAAAAVAVGVCAAPVFFLSDTAIQEAVPEGERARVFSARDALARGAFLVTAGATAPLVAAQGTRLPLALAGAMLLAIGLAIGLPATRRSTRPHPNAETPT
jgi:MFS family permease